MAAEFHLAENTLALHLLLQHLEGLIDIVVTDENLHAAFLFNRAVDGPPAIGARAAGAGICDSQTWQSLVWHRLWQRLRQASMEIAQRQLCATFPARPASVAVLEKD